MSRQDRSWRTRAIAAAAAGGLVLGAAAVPVSALEPDVPVAPGTTVRTSKDAGEGGGRELPAMSANGRFVAFVGRGESNQGVWMVDRLKGTTERLTTGNHFNPAISDSGRYVAYVVYGASREVHLLDRVTDADVIVSVGDDESASSGISDYPSVDATGRYVAFQSTDANLDPRVTDAPAGGGPTKAYVRDTLLGETHMVSVTDDGVKPQGNAIKPDITPDGRFVAFASDASNLLPPVAPGAGAAEEEPAAAQQVYRHDRSTGLTQLVSVGTDGLPADAISAGEFGPSISGDGSRVAFESEATNLVADDTNLDRDAFVRDLAAATTVRVSVDETGAQIDVPDPVDPPEPAPAAEGPTGPRAGAGPAISGNGRIVAFHTEVDILEADVNGVVDVYVYDVELDQLVERASVANEGGTDASGTRIDGNSGLEVPQVNGQDAVVSWSGLDVSFVGNGDLSADRPIEEPEPLAGTGAAEEPGISTEPATFTRTRVLNVEAPASSFPDVSPTSPFIEQIDWAADQELLVGFTDGTFRPTTVLSRQQAAGVLHRLAGSPTGTFPDPGFTDVPATNPFATAIAWAASEGIVAGYDDGTFRPASPVSRQAFAAFVHRFDGAPAGPFPDPGYSDLTPANPLFDEVAYAAANWVVNGFDDGTFRPTNAITRQTAASYLARFVPAMAAS